MSIFKGFKADPPAKLSDYENVTIALQTDYMDGSGWNKGQATAFEEDVYPALKLAGFKLVEAEQKAYCPYIRSAEINNKLNLYLHPQAITGDGKMDDINKIIDTLKECPTVYDVRLHYHEPVYDISDHAYHTFLLEHSDEIIECMQEAILRGKEIYRGEIGYEFARDCRLPRIGDGSGFGFDDTDVQTIRDIYIMAEKNGLLDPDYIREQREQEEYEL